MAYWEDEEEEEEEENESYLASYSDLVTDLMAVFVLLLSFALLSQGVKIRESAEKLADSTKAIAEEAEQGEVTDVDRFVKKLEDNITLAGLDGELSVNREYPEDGNTTGKDSDKPVDTKSEQPDTAETGALGQVDPLETNIEKFIMELREEIKDAGLDGRVSVNRQGKKRVVTRLMDSVLFDVGKAEIKEEVKPVLARIAGILSKYDKTIEYIHIEGHTDTLPISTEQFPSNWELSTGRAGSVVRYLIGETTIKDEKFSSAGYGEFRPIADNTTEEGRALNRRVEFSIELKESDAAK